MHQIWLPILVSVKGHYMVDLQMQVADAAMAQASSCSDAVLPLPTPIPFAGHNSTVNGAKSQQPPAAESISNNTVLGCIMQTPLAPILPPTLPPALPPTLPPTLPPSTPPMSSICSSSKDPVPATQPTSTTPSFTAQEYAYAAMLGRGTTWYSEFTSWADGHNNGPPKVFLVCSRLLEDLSTVTKEHVLVAKWLQNNRILYPDAYQVVQRAALHNTKSTTALAEANITQGSSTVAASAAPQVNFLLDLLICFGPSLCLSCSTTVVSIEHHTA